MVKLGVLSFISQLEAKCLKELSGDETATVTGPLMSKCLLASNLQPRINTDFAAAETRSVRLACMWLKNRLRLTASQKFRIELNQRLLV